MGEPICKCAISRNVYPHARDSHEWAASFFLVPDEAAEGRTVSEDLS